MHGDIQTSFGNLPIGIKDSRVKISGAAEVRDHFANAVPAGGQLAVEMAPVFDKFGFAAHGAQIAQVVPSDLLVGMEISGGRPVAHVYFNDDITSGLQLS